MHAKLSLKNLANQVVTFTFNNGNIKCEFERTISTYILLGRFYFYFKLIIYQVSVSSGS